MAVLTLRGVTNNLSRARHYIIPNIKHTYAHHLARIDEGASTERSIDCTDTTARLDRATNREGTKTLSQKGVFRCCMRKLDTVVPLSSVS